jgi:hypothetical protein
MKPSIHQLNTLTKPKGVFEMLNKKLKKLTLTGAASLLVTMAAGPASAADWLTLQGLEPAGSAQPARVWGFVQAQYQDDASDPNAAGGYIPPMLIGPNLESQSAFNVNRARIGVRGVAMPLDSNINYFLLVELGNNGITEPGDAFAKATDASVSFSHLEGARVRAGLFKYPGAEEGLQAIHVFDYINFTSVTGQMLLERFPNRKYTSNIAPQTLPPETDLNGFDDGVGAFRDVGVQVFNTFGLSNGWEVSYAAMIGNGNGLNFSDNNDDKDFYLYASTEKVYAGAGARRQGLKLFAWLQDGTRTADLTNDDTFNPVDYDRDRYGFGVKYLRNGIRATAEYMDGEGMIWQAPQNPSYGIGPGQGNPSAPGNGAFAEANGYYVEGGYRFPGTKWELDLRYDVYNRLEGDRFEIEFVRTTFGVQYFFNPRVRIALNYEVRDFEAVNFDDNAGPNRNVGGVDNRIAIQVTGIWSQ